MIRLFLTNNILVLFILPFIVSIYFLLNYLFGFNEQESQVNFGFWLNPFETNSIILNIASFIIMLINTLLLNWVFNRNEFLERNSYIVSLLYVVSMSFYNSFYKIDGLLISHLFMISMFTQFFQLNQNQDARRLVFNGCFFAGLATTFYPPLIIALPFCLAMIFIIRPFVFREFFLGIIGFNIPLIYGFVFLFFQDKKNYFSIFGQLNELKITTNFLVTLIILFSLFALSILSLRLHIQKSSLRLKNMIRIISIYIWLSIIIGVLNFYYFLNIEQLSFLLIPISLLFTYSFMQKNISTVANIIFYLTMIYSVAKFFIISPNQSI